MQSLPQNSYRETTSLWPICCMSEQSNMRRWVSARLSASVHSAACVWHKACSAEEQVQSSTGNCVSGGYTAVLWLLALQARLQLQAEAALVQQLRQQLAAATSRAEVAEEQVRQQVQLGEELQHLRTEASSLLSAKHDSEQQCKAPQEQLTRWVARGCHHQRPTPHTTHPHLEL